ncbi:helix-turn-helix transcriptional regulator [Pseudonocardia sp.]|jgi:poly-beta-hydroxybutyrate-responsive repressor|uniref:helix-turn-helix transcriptional regulator n=1 Tax=Pseudonocardia sp. TaxID=60912 RepID=UPI003D0C6734
MGASRRQEFATSTLGAPLAELEPRNFLQPCLLLLLREQPDHGYELAARLRPMHDGDGDAGGVYRALRGLEKRGLVRSQWESSEVGPARRIYHITSEGLACLDAQARGLRHVDDALHVFLDRYAKATGAGGPGGPRGAVQRAHAGASNGRPR